jgi:RNA recognition motif-containing protein
MIFRHFLYLENVVWAPSISRFVSLGTNGNFSLQKESRMNIYVGNLSYEVTEEDLRQAFEAFGQVDSLNIIKDKYSGQSKGFGFVEMPSKDEAQSAIDGLNGKELKGRALNVNEARPRSESGGGGGRRTGGGGRGFGGGRGGGRRY